MRSQRSFAESGLVAVLTALLSLTLPSTSTAQELVLAEFLASNHGGLLDQDGDDSDWIEILNRGSTSVDLDGWFLTDNLLDPTRWSFPSTLLGAGERLLVFASDKDRALSGQELHTNFKLSSAGEYLALLRPDQSPASLYSPAFPPQSENISYGLRPATQEMGYFEPPTPGAPNGNLFAPLERPSASAPSGWQSLPTLVELTALESGAQVFFTLDGSLPSITNGSPYLFPISINSTTLVRAVSTLAGSAPSPPLSRTYLFASDVLAQDEAAALARNFPADWIEADGTSWASQAIHPPGAWYGMYPGPLAGLTNQEQIDALESFPTLCLSMDPEDWFGYDPQAGKFGIYPNSTEDGAAWVRATDIELFETDGTFLSASCGVSVQGGGSTAEYNRSQLSLALRFKSEFGQSKLEWPLFGEGAVERFDYLVLDANHQYAINQRFTPSAHLVRDHCQEARDAFASDLQLALGQPAAHSRHMHLFLNGHYWGVYVLHERPDDHFAEETFGGDSDEYDYVKHGVVRDGNPNPADHPTAPGAWAIAVDIATGGLAPGDTYQGQSAWDLFHEYVNVESYIDYVILNFYLGNVDWPSHNWIAVGHGRNGPSLEDADPAPSFRFYSWDAEAILHDGTHGTLVGDGVWDRSDFVSSDPENALFFHTELLGHPDYVTHFGDRVWKHISPGGALFVQPGYASSGTVFDPNEPQRNRPAALYYERTQAMTQAIPLELARWVNYWPNNPGYSLADWHAERQRLLEELLPVRTGVLVEQLRTGVLLYPEAVAPFATPRGGVVPANSELDLWVQSGGTTYYTLNGEDPRLPGGAVSPNAITYTGLITLAGSGGALQRIRARTRWTNEWSPLESVDFLVGQPAVRLNELQAANRSTHADEHGEFDDWCELVNRRVQPVDISGWRLTDDAADPDRYVFPQGTIIPARGRLLVWLDGEPEQGLLHANFSLSQAGELLQLRAPIAFGDVLVDQIQFGPQSPDRSLGRFPDGLGAWNELITPTPGGRNRIPHRDGQ